MEHWWEVEKNMEWRLEKKLEWQIMNCEMYRKKVVSKYIVAGYVDTGRVIFISFLYNMLWKRARFESTGLRHKIAVNK